MPPRPPRLRHLTALLPTLLVLMNGCALVRVDLAAPVADFSATTTAAGELIAAYYTTLNDYERELRIATYAAEGSVVSLTETDPATQEPRFQKWWTGPFDPRAIALRVRLLKLLGRYADDLLTLSSDEQDQRLRDRFADVGGSLTALSAQWTALGAQGLDARAQAYVGPLTTLAGEVGILAQARHRDAMLSAGITTAKPAINQLLGTLEDDFERVVLQGHALGELQRLTDAVMAYNEQEPARRQRLAGMATELAALPATGGTPEQARLRIDLQRNIALERSANHQERLADLQQLKVIYDSYLSFVSGAPTRLFPRIRAAFAALTTYVEADRTPKDYRTLVEQLKELRDETQQLVAAAKTVHALGKEN